MAAPMLAAAHEMIEVLYPDYQVRCNAELIFFSFGHPALHVLTGDGNRGRARLRSGGLNTLVNRPSGAGDPGLAQRGRRGSDAAVVGPLHDSPAGVRGGLLADE